MSTPPLIATCWTHAGDAVPQSGDERSPFNILDRVAAASAAGWSGIGFVYDDLQEAKNTIGLSALGSAIRDAGLDFVEVEFLGDWWTTGEERIASDKIRRDLFEAAEVLGAQTLKVSGKMFSDDVDLDVMAKEFDALADEAREVGVRIGLEALPFTNFSTVPMGNDFVVGVGNTNGGLFMDIWHVFRGGTTLEELRTAINPDYLVAVELNDAKEPAPPKEGLWDDTINERKLPGQGDWDVPGFINVVRDLGYQGPWGVEVLSFEHRAKSLEEEVTSAIAATRACFAEADRLR